MAAAKAERRPRARKKKKNREAAKAEVAAVPLAAAFLRCTAAVPLATAFLRCRDAAVLSRVCKSFRNDSAITNRFCEKVREEEKAKDEAEHLYEQFRFAEQRALESLTDYERAEAERMTRALRTALEELNDAQTSAGM